MLHSLQAVWRPAARNPDYQLVSCNPKERTPRSKWFLCFAMDLYQVIPIFIRNNRHEQICKKETLHSLVSKNVVYSVQWSLISSRLVQPWLYPSTLCNKLHQCSFFCFQVWLSSINQLLRRFSIIWSTGYWPTTGLLLWGKMGSMVQEIPSLSLSWFTTINSGRNYYKSRQNLKIDLKPCTELLYFRSRRLF